MRGIVIFNWQYKAEFRTIGLLDSDLSLRLSALETNGSDTPMKNAKWDPGSFHSSEFIISEIVENIHDTCSNANRGNHILNGCVASIPMIIEQEPQPCTSTNAAIVSCTAGNDIEDGDDDSIECINSLEHCEEPGTKYHSVFRKKIFPNDVPLLRSKSFRELDSMTYSQITLVKMRRDQNQDYYLQEMPGMRLPTIFDCSRTPANHRYHNQRCAHLDCSTWHLSELHTRKRPNGYVLSRFYRRMQKITRIGWKKLKPKSNTRGDYIIHKSCSNEKKAHKLEQILMIILITIIKT